MRLSEYYFETTQVLLYKSFIWYTVLYFPSVEWLMGQFSDTVHDILKDGTHEEVDMVRKLLLNQVEEMTELEREAGVCLCKLQDQRSRELLHQVKEKSWEGRFCVLQNFHDQ